MDNRSNIVIADESAVSLYLHSRGTADLGLHTAYEDPLESCAITSEELCAFNTANPLYGGEPVVLLVPEMSMKRRTHEIKSRCCSCDLPSRSFLKLRDSLFVASPELAFARMGALLDEAQMVELGMNLCARYYIQLPEKRIEGRDAFLTTPESLARYAESVKDLKGSRRALRALRWVLSNSGSPEETRTKIQFCHPIRLGGFGLSFTAMNYDFAAGRNARLSEQGEFCIDLADPLRRFGLEYDGADYHTDASKDKRRRNALAALGWQVFPIDGSVLMNPEETERTALQVAKRMGVRIRRSSSWGQKYIELRTSLGLPV